MHDVEALTRGLRDAADEMPPTRLPDDLFRRGRRRGRRKRVILVGAVLAVLLLVPVGLGLGGAGRHPQPPATPNPDPAVPSTVHQPRVFQATVQDAPRGAASMLFSGEGGGLGGLYYSSNIAAVGRDGSYRMLPAELNAHAGTDAVLSPDGSHVAMTWPGTHTLTLESLLSRHDVYVADLATGDIRGYRLSESTQYDTFGSFAWSPDGRSLAVAGSTLPRGPGSPVMSTDLVLVDTVTGAVRGLSSFANEENTALGVAFSPDGRQVAVQALTTLSIVDTADGTVRRLPDLPARTRLAGSGAWTPDGRLAVSDVDGCLRDCRAAAADARTWRLRYLDPRSGAETPDPTYDAVDGMVAEVLGWQPDGDVVVLTYRSSTPTGGTVYEGDRREPQLLVLHAGGGRDRLIALPAFVDRIDVAHDLVVADRFGGPAPAPAVWPIAHYVYRVTAALLFVFVALPLLAWRLIRRVRRRRP
jgi:WD40 repeat protein